MIYGGVQQHKKGCESEGAGKRSTNKISQYKVVKTPEMSLHTVDDIIQQFG